MSEPRQRLSISVDASVAAHARKAVAEGRATSISAWVADALRRHNERDADDRDRRLDRDTAIDEFIAAYEAEHGTISDEDIAAAERAFAQRAVVGHGTC